MSSSGEQSNGYPGGPAISADSRYVAFSSDASNLVPGDTNGKNDVFVRDRKLHTTTRASVSSTGAQLDGNSYGGAISANGRYVIFVFGDEVFVRDLKLHKTTEVSVSHNGGPPNSASGFRGVDISADGRYIAFMSRASNLVRHDKNRTWDVFVRDQKLGTTRLMSVASDGHQANGQSFSPSISADGRYVAFESRARNLVHGDTNEQTDVFVRDRKRHTTKRVSVSSTGHQADDESFNTAISADGRYVAFASHARNLIHRDTNGVTDVFVRDRKRNTTRRVSVSSDEHQGNKASRYLAISPDGRYIAFSSGSSNLVPGDTNHTGDVFVRDRKHHRTKRVSLSSAGKQGNRDSLAPAISSDGHSVAFYSEASNLVPGDTNGTPDVFVRGPLP